jgi:hypothetical protein
MEGGVEFVEEGCAEGVEGFGTVELDYDTWLAYTNRMVLRIACSYSSQRLALARRL